MESFFTDQVLSGSLTKLQKSRRKTVLEARESRQRRMIGKWADFFLLGSKMLLFDWLHRTMARVSGFSRVQTKNFENHAFKSWSSYF